jgi:hypothetical protein
MAVSNARSEMVSRCPVAEVRKRQSGAGPCVICFSALLFQILPGSLLTRVARAADNVNSEREVLMPNVSHFPRGCPELNVHSKESPELRQQNGYSTTTLT